MDLDLTDEQQQVVDTVRGFLVDRCPPEVVRTAEEVGFDPDVWAGLCSMVGPAIAVPEAQGGGGASLLDAELIAEPLGSFLAPVPFIEGVVAARALARSGAPGLAALASLATEPSRVITIGLTPGVDGTVTLVPFGSVADTVVGLDGDELVVVSGTAGAPHRRNLGSAAVADRSLRSAGRTVVARGDEARRGYAQALDEWRVLMSGALVGLGATALAIGAEYAKERHQFGVPIGSFQSIARDLADVATLVDGARLLSREAAWAAEEEDQDGPSLAAMAFGFATRAARRASNVSLHVHGGYGFTLEYDIQLYYRRAQAWPLGMGDPRRETAHLADALFGPIEVS